VLRTLAGIVTVLLTLTLASSATLSPTVERTPVETAFPVVTPRLACAALPSRELGNNAGITYAAVVGEACEVRGVIAPQIQFLVRLPIRSYRQRYLQTGCGGLCGRLNISASGSAGCAPLNDGSFVTASNNLGHVGAGTADGNFGTDTQLRVDFAYRADHLTAVTVKQLIKAFYGQPPRYSYFDGCSQGGHEALTEAQRFPDDFDGILSGAPAMLFTELNAFHQAWMALADYDADGHLILPISKLPALHAAVLRRCDRIDGLADGLIDDPRACRFDPASLACPRGVDKSDCLTPEQVAVVRKIYAGAAPLYPGGEPYGSELAWTGWLIRPDQKSTSAWRLANGWLRYLAFDPPLSATPGTVVFDAATFAQVARLAPLWDAASPDLTAFRRSGGKLIIWHGWADQAIPPTGTVAYYQAIQARMGATTSSFARLFLFPGMYHCSGGDGPSSFDLLTPLLNWVEAGTSPDRVIAAQKIGSTVVRTRPVYPYPLVARYRGSGDPNSAASFSPARSRDFGPYPWLGTF
jgi:feruloyl esterase